MFWSRLMLAATFVASPLPALASDLTVDLSGVRTGSGDLYISVQTREQFLKETGTYGAVIKMPKAAVQSVKISGVAPGTYHIAIWHDVDGDKKFSVDADGRPTDGWSAYRAETLRAAPQWEQVEYRVTDGPARVALTMIYPEPKRQDGE